MREKAAKNTSVNPLTPHNRLPVEDRVSVNQNLYAFLPSWPWHEKVPCDLDIVYRRLKEGHAISEPSNQSRDGNVQLCIGQTKVQLSHVRRYLPRTNKETTSPSSQCSAPEMEGVGSSYFMPRHWRLPFEKDSK